MLLKRIFDHSSGKPVLDHVKVLRSSDRQNFSTRVVEKQTAEGLMTLGQGKIILHTEPLLTYRIVRGPGLYCVYCDAPVDDGPAAKAHIEAMHKGAPPDETNPAGYRRDNFYATVKEGSNG